MCGITDVKGCIETAVVTTEESLAKTVMDFTTTAFTLWMGVDTANPLTEAWPTGDAGAPADPTLIGPLSTIWGSLLPLTGFFGILGIIIACVRAVRSNSAMQLLDIGRLVFNLVAVSSFGVVVVWLGISGADLYAPWIMSQVGEPQPDASTVERLIDAKMMQQTGLLGILLGGGLLIVSNIGMIAFMILRSALLLLLLAVWPTVAAATGTEAGNHAFSKINKWLIALILFKPAAATIYAFGFYTMGDVQPTDINDVGQAIYRMVAGILIIMLALVSLPAMVKFLSPPAGIGASNAFSGGAIAAGAVAVGAVAATGGAALAAGGGAAAAGGAGAAAGGGGAGAGAGAGGAGAGAGEAGATGAAEAGSTGAQQAAGEGAGGGNDSPASGGGSGAAGGGSDGGVVSESSSEGGSGDGRPTPSGGGGSGSSGAGGPGSGGSSSRPAASAASTGTGAGSDSTGGGGGSPDASGGAEGSSAEGSAGSGSAAGGDGGPRRAAPDSPAAEGGSPAEGAKPAGEGGEKKQPDEPGPSGPEGAQSGGGTGRLPPTAETLQAASEAAAQSRSDDVLDDKQ